MFKLYRILFLFLLLNILSYSKIEYKSLNKLKSQAKPPVSKIRNNRIKVIYMPPATEYNYYRSIGKGIQQYSNLLDLEYKLLAPQIDNPSNQLKIIKDVVRNNEADIIIFSTHNPTLISREIEKAVDKGIIVILVNSDIPDFITPIHAVVGYNQRKGTRKMGEYLAKLSNEKEFNIGILEGTPGYHSTERVGGFFDEMKKHSNLKLIAQENGNWNVIGGFNATMKMLNENSEIDAIFAANDYEIIGAMSAAETLGRNDIIFMGNDGDEAALEKISNNELHATLNTSPFEMGEVALQVGIDILEKEFDGGFIETPGVIVDKTNISKYYNKQQDFRLGILKLKPILILTEEYENLSNRRGEGLYFDILKEIYTPYEIDLEYKILPFVRAIKSLKDAHLEGDIVLGGLPGAIEGVYFPQWHYNVDTASAFFKKSKVFWAGESSMENRTVAMIRNYNLDQYLFTNIILDEKARRDSTMMMVIRGRIDFFLDVRSETEKVLENLNIQDIENYALEDLFQLRKYLCFRDNVKGRKLAEIFDKEFPKLIANGKLKKMFEKWDVPYPF